MINAFQHENEWNSLLKHVKKLNSFIEIGSYKGGTFESLAKITKGKKISIDLATGGFGGQGLIASKERNARISSRFQNTHFIEGDSSKFETIKQLHNILNGEQVDLLFIDGDHTYKGVLTDYMLYKQYVKQGGYIVFHDIVDSEFHRGANCCVSTLWNKLQGQKIEFISPDNSDALDDACNVGDIVWGGIGIIKNNFERDVHIFQCIYDQISIDLCINSVGNYIPELILNTDTSFCENAVIRKVYSNYKFKKSDYVGITSPIVTQKTKLTIDDLVSLCYDCDVVNYGALKIIAGNNTDVWAANGNGREGTNLYKAAVELNNAKVLDFDIFEQKWTTIYCNYFICKEDIFTKYCETVLNKVMDYLRTTNWIEWNNPKTGLYHRQRYYPVSIFVCECMFGTFLSRNNYIVKDITLFFLNK